MLQVGANVGVVTHQVPCHQQQIEKIEDAGALFEGLVIFDDGAHLIAQQRR